MGMGGLRKGLKGQKEEWGESTKPKGRELIKEKTSQSVLRLQLGSVVYVLSKSFQFCPDG